MKVLVTRTDRLGDLVLALPAVARLKAARPDWEVHVMVGPGAVPLVENDPHVTRVWTWQDDQDPGTGRDLVRDLRQAGFTAAVMLQYRRELAGVLRQAGVARRYGPWSKWSSWFCLNRGLRQNRSVGGRHEMEFNLQLVERLLTDEGVATGPVPTGPQLYLTAAQQHRAREFRAGLANGAAKVVFVHPGSGGSALDWEPGRFGAVANGLAENPGWRVFVTGSPADAATIGALSGDLSPRVTVLVGHYDLRNFLAVLAAGDLFVGPSTGPLHMAAALGVPTVGLFPPLRTMRPTRWGPRGPVAYSGRNLVPDLDCPARRQCRLGRCPHYNCLDGIGVADVMQAARKILAGAPR